MNIAHQKEVKEKMDFSVDISYTLDEVTINHIQKVLLKSDGKIHGKGGAAELLGINPNTLRNRMNKLGIKYIRKNKKVHNEITKRKI